VIASDSLTIPSRLTAIDDARRWVTGHIAPAGASVETVWEVELALTEALSNIMRHAYGGDESQRIELGLELDERRLELRIVDFGKPFALDAYQEPDLEASPTGGYGVQMIGELMDEVERTDGSIEGTCLRLVKYQWKEAT
jgi:serine/threonine-protein kinase RsbW